MAQTKMKEYIYPLRIYYEDTDFNGFVYFANYLKYMERATTHLIAELGLKATDLKKLNALIAVRSVQCHYFRPATLDDEIEVVTKVANYNEVTITWDYTIRSRINKEIIYCHATIERVCVNLQLFPIKLPDPILSLVAKFA